MTLSEQWSRVPPSFVCLVDNHSVTDVLVLAAHPLELDPVVEILAGYAGALTVDLQAVGVGLAAAGSGAATVFARSGARMSLLLGSVGVFPSAGVADEGLVVATATRLVSSEALAGHVEFPSAMAQELAFDAGLVAELGRVIPDVHQGRVATTLGITTDESLAAALAANGERFENLEAMAVAEAARLHDVPIAGLFGISNTVGPEGREQWARNHSRVAVAVAQGFRQWLDEANRQSDLR